MKKTGVDYVKEESREYLEALSQAGYIIGNMVLPGSFVKKETQVYFNPMLEIYDRKSVRLQNFSQLRQGSFMKQIISAARLRVKQRKHGWKNAPWEKSMMEK